MTFSAGAFALFASFERRRNFLLGTSSGASRGETDGFKGALAPDTFLVRFGGGISSPLSTLRFSC